MTRASLVRLIAVHDAIWECWWPALLGLPPAQAHRRVGGSYPTLFLTARHMVNAEIWWQDRLEGAQGPDDLATRSMARIGRVWWALRDRRLGWLAKADPRRRVAFEADGSPAAMSAWECVVHVATHAHYHRGQLAAQCRALRVRPPSRHYGGRFIGEF